MERTIRPGAEWQAVDAGYGDIRYDLADGIAKITICRPEVRNAFRPQTLFELQDAFERARDDRDVGVIVLTGEGPTRSARAATSASAATTATSATTASAGSTCSTSRSRSAACRSRWSRWSRATRSAAATCCTSCATSPSPPTTRASARPARGSARSTAGTARAARALGRAEEGARDLVPLPRSTTRRQALDMGLVNTVVPARGARGGDGRVVPRDAAAQPARAAHDQGVVQRGRRRPRRHPAARGRRDAPLLHERGGAGGQARLPREAHAPTSPSSRSARDADRRREWVQGARPRTLGAAVAPVLVGTAAAVADADGVIVVAVRGRAGRRARAAGRRELRERLLRRRARHRPRAQGPAAAHRDRDSRRRARCGTRPRSAFGVAAVVGARALAGRRTRGCCSSASPPSPPPCSTPADPKPLRLHRARRGAWCSCSSASSRRSAPRTCRSRRSRARRGGARSSSGCSPAPSCSPTTCATSRPTPSSGKRTLAVRVGAPATRRLFVACYVGSFVVGRRHRHHAAVGAARPARAAARGRAGARRCLTRADPPSLVARAGRDVAARAGRRASW